MSINAHDADERELGEFIKLVNSIRNNNGLLSDEQIIAFMRIKTETLENIQKLLSQHPDWDDEQVADEVLSLEDNDL